MISKSIAIKNIRPDSVLVEGVVGVFCRKIGFWEVASCQLHSYRFCASFQLHSYQVLYFSCMDFDHKMEAKRTTEVTCGL
ncbi:hypothetical protein L2E82_43152 [Cichorium intybus]|uniref:Uncharacterized protein n=1 Tax=Cichorium intybus TaxID=13427 RepID=A0ACB8ZNM8_CICIN|nr:hypothetical protein L2E82_43152 [Cichorium intybus]